MEMMTRMAMTTKLTRGLAAGKTLTTGRQALATAAADQTATTATTTTTKPRRKTMRTAHMAATSPISAQALMSALSRLPPHLAATGREFIMEDIRYGLFKSILALLLTCSLLDIFLNLNAIEYFGFPRPIST